MPPEQRQRLLDGLHDRLGFGAHLTLYSVPCRT
jgi:hypothetical protein